VVAEITIDQKLRWIPEGAWEWRFPTVVGPRYLGSPGYVADAERVTVDVQDGPSPVSLALELSVRDALTAEPSSPSHAIRTTRTADACEIRLASDRGAGLDRDLVARWPVATASIGTRLEVACLTSKERDGTKSFGLLTLVPPADVASHPPISRDLVVLIDASGSMSGAPLEQARCVAQTLVRSLDARDTLELIAFSSEPLRFRARAEQATETLRANAIEWLGKLQASGGTEMDRAVSAALAPLRTDAQRQIVLVTDGLIGFENEIVSHVLRALPDTSRLHTVGVGSAVNRSLTAGAARAGRGIEIVVGIDEDGGGAARRLLAHLAAPIVTEIEIRGSAVRRSAPARLRDLAAGAPALVALDLDPAGGEVEIRGRGFERRIAVPAAEPGTGRSALASLFARECVEDLEMRAAAGEEVDLQIEELGMAFGIATRRTSWVAVSEEPAVDPRRPTRRARIPQAIPHGLSVEGLGLPSFSGTLETDVMRCITSTLAPGRKLRGAIGSSASPRVGDGRRLLHRFFSSGVRGEPRLHRGRIISTNESEIVIEIEVGDAGLRWNPLPRAQLFLAGPENERIEVAVDLARSTAPGRIDAHLVIRIILHLAAALPATPSHLAVFAGREELLVELRS
jgi:Ca-activated chloride channel family protein